MEDATQDLRPQKCSWAPDLWKWEPPSPRVRLDGPWVRPRSENSSSEFTLPMQRSGRPAEPIDGTQTRTAGSRCSRAATAPPSISSSHAGAQRPSIRRRHSPGATSPAGAAASCCATSNTPPLCTASRRRWRRRRAARDGRWRSSTRPTGRRGFSATTTACTPSTPTLSASCAGRGSRGRSSWSGSAAPCGPPPWPPGSPPTCATRGTWHSPKHWYDDRGQVTTRIPSSELRRHVDGRTSASKAGFLRSGAN